MRSPRHLTVCAAFVAGLLIVQGEGASAAIVVKGRTGAALVDTQTEDKARAPAPKAAELAFNVSLPFAKLTQLINQFEFKFSAKGTAVGLISYNGTLTVGKIAVASSGNAAFPVRTVAPFRLVGTVAGRAIDLNGEATLDFAFDVGSDWCPILKFDDASVAFTDKAVLPANVTKSIPSFTEFVATKFLNDELKSNLTCHVIKKEIAKAWGPVSLPVTAAGKQLFLQLDPQSLAVSNVVVSQDRISFSASLGAATVVSLKAPSQKKRPLPQVKPIAQHAVKDAASEADATLSLPINLDLR